MAHTRLASAWSQRHYTLFASASCPLLASNGSLSGENDYHETSRSLRRQHSTVDNHDQRETRSLQPTVLPEMRTRQPATELGSTFFWPERSTVWERTFFFLIFLNCSVRNRTAVVTKHLRLLSIRKKNQRSKTKKKTSQGLVTCSQLNSHRVLVLRGRGRSNHVATKTLPRLAPGQ